MPEHYCEGCGHPHFPGMHDPRPVDRPDMVNHPPHYGGDPSGVECIDVVEHRSFNVGNAMKYLWRAGKKGDVIEDLQKAAWYVNREIERLKRTET